MGKVAGAPAGLNRWAVAVVAMGLCWERHSDLMPGVKHSGENEKRRPPKGEGGVSVRRRDRNYSPPGRVSNSTKPPPDSGSLAIQLSILGSTGRP